jgi:transketolase
VPTYTPNSEAAKGGSVRQESSTGAPEVILIATGSEALPAVGARERREAEGVGPRVVSMPSVEGFEEQAREYRERVLPPSVRARVAVEAGIGPTWYRYVGDHGRIVSLEHLGASADARTLFAEYGFTSEHVLTAAREALAAGESLAAVRG